MTGLTAKLKYLEIDQKQARPQFCATGFEGGIKSLGEINAGNHTVSHAQNKSPMRIKFKSAAIALALCLVLQVQADTVLGKVINVADTTWQQHEPADQSAPCAS